MSTKKKAAPKPAGPKRPTADENIAMLTKKLLEQIEVNVRLRHDYDELKQDYLELTEQIAASSTVAKRILARHSIGRSSTFVQGINKSNF